MEPVVSVSRVRRRSPSWFTVDGGVAEAPLLLLGAPADGAGGGAPGGGRLRDDGAGGAGGGGGVAGGGARRRPRAPRAAADAGSRSVVPATAAIY